MTIKKYFASLFVLEKAGKQLQFKYKLHKSI